MITKRMIADIDDTFPIYLCDAHTEDRIRGYREEGQQQMHLKLARKAEVEPGAECEGMLWDRAGQEGAGPRGPA